MLSISVMSSASSCCIAGSPGATAASDVLSNVSFRSRSSGSTRSLNCAAAAARSVVAAITLALAAAATVLVSEVMKLFCTHAARPASIHSASSCDSASLIKASASSIVTVGSVTGIVHAARNAAMPVATMKCWKLWIRRRICVVGIGRSFSAPARVAPRGHRGAMALHYSVENEWAELRGRERRKARRATAPRTSRPG